MYEASFAPAIGESFISMAEPERHRTYRKLATPAFRSRAVARYERDGLAPGVYTTAVGYAGGSTPNPSYEEVCSGLTGHTEAVLVVFDPKILSYVELLRLFWEMHDPTQGMRQGNDVGTQYRSAIYTYSDAQARAAAQSLEEYQAALSGAGVPEVTTELREAPPFYYAEHHHQQYLAKVPNGYCGLGGTGVCYPVASRRS